MSRILCVEDEVANRVLMRDILKRAGYDVTEVADGASALSALEAESIDLVVMDLRLPGVSGIEITRRIRENPSFESLPIIGLSADLYIVRESIAAGCDESLSKPVHPRNLLEAVKRLLGS